MQYKKVIMISVAITILVSIYLAFSEVNYFHPLAIAIICIAGLVSALLFFFSYSLEEKDGKRKKKSTLKINIYLLLIIFLFFFLVFIQLVAIAVITTIAGIFLLGILTKKLSSYKLYAVLLIGIIIISVISYLPLANLRKTNWSGIDEIAFNYYASYLLLHGVNPYTSSMQPILDKYNVPTTILLNGAYEYKYDYPAMSFLPVLPLPLIIPYVKLHSFLIFIVILVLITVLVSFLVYRGSNFNRAVLIPLAIWVIASYTMMGSIDQYISVSLFLVIAYMERKNVALSAIFLGLAASTIQLAWFALPFFYILVLNEQGKRKMVQSILISLVVFLLVNSYFLILSPGAVISSSFSLFGTARLVPYGPNLFQLLLVSYPVPIWCSAVLSIVAMLLLMALFYLYTSTLKPLLAIAPTFIFFFGWRNLPMYGLAYIPLLIAVCYFEEKKISKDIIKNRNYIYLAFAVFAAFSVVLVVYAHGVYLDSKVLSINYASSTMQRATNGSNTYVIHHVTLNISNSGNTPQNVSFIFVNYKPDRDTFVSSLSLNGVMPHSYQNYTLNFTANGITENANVFILGFSEQYIITNSFTVNLPGSN